jgi:chorismate mutase
MTNENVELIELRAAIDNVDSQIVRLLNERVEIAVKMGVLKTKLKKPIRDENREAEVKRKLSLLTDGESLSEYHIHTIYETIMHVCLEIQQNLNATIEAQN